MSSCRPYKMEKKKRLTKYMRLKSLLLVSQNVKLKLNIKELQVMITSLTSRLNETENQLVISEIN